MLPACSAIDLSPTPSNILTCSSWWFGWQLLQSPAMCSSFCLSNECSMRRVAIQAIDFVFADVLVMHELEIFDLGQIIFAIVADHAPFLGHFTLAADHIDVAVEAVNAFEIGQFVREFHAAAEIVFFVGNLVAVRASAQAFVKRLILEMAQKTSALGHRDVLALHDLPVATGAAKLDAVRHIFFVRCGIDVFLLSDMPGVIEIDVVEIDAPRKQPGFMAARAQAACVGYFRGGARAGAGREVFGELHQSQHFAADFAAQPGREMALDARDVFVFRCRPGGVNTAP